MFLNHLDAEARAIVAAALEAEEDSTKNEESQIVVPSESSS